MVGHELNEVIGEQNAVTVIEWGDVVESVIPKGAIRITIQRSTEGEDVRDLHVEYPDKKAYMFTELKKS